MRYVHELTTCRLHSAICTHHHHNDIITAHLPLRMSIWWRHGLRATHAASDIRAFRAFTCSSEIRTENDEQCSLRNAFLRAWRRVANALALGTKCMSLASYILDRGRHQHSETRILHSTAFTNISDNADYKATVATPSVDSTCCVIDHACTTTGTV
jgi:hypothetical protein